MVELRVHVQHSGACLKFYRYRYKGRPCGVIIKNKIPDSYIGSSTDSPAFIPSDLALNCPKETGYSSIPANRSAQTKFVPLSGWNDGAMEPKITICWSCTKKNYGGRPPLISSQQRYKSPPNYTDQSKYALALRKNLIENITE